VGPVLRRLDLAQVQPDTAGLQERHRLALDLEQERDLKHVSVELDCSINIRDTDVNL
jgi:membrane protein YdbS with pleckstrin-like domain